MISKKNLLPLFLGGFILGGCASTLPPPKISKLPIVHKVEVDEKVSSQPSDMNRLVLVGLKVNVPEMGISCKGSFSVKDLTTGFVKELKEEKIQISARSFGIVLNGKSFGRKVVISPRNSTEYISFGSRKVRGKLKAIASHESKVTIVNELDLDAYLKGVLPREVIVTWPKEALKAQAVASRTYLISHLGRHKKEGFDVCSDVHCQVYGGVNREHPQTSKAVEETRGEILEYNGKPIQSFFHACCGGHTEKVGAVWGSQNKPYLPAKRCGYGKAAPWYNWSLNMSNGEILSLLKKPRLVKGSQLKSIKVKTKSKSARAEVITVTTEKGSFNVSGNAFRLALHPEKIRSTLWTNLSKKKNGYHFEGRGWGHGVGLCQWGARGQALQNLSYKKILGFYYPEAKLKS
ncbi:hypothetical protein BVX98_02655 [bacterium F11]|nr:hypothetical protein BVX98_02655 [bacterium F11]